MHCFLFAILNLLDQFLSSDFVSSLRFYFSKCCNLCCELNICRHVSYSEEDRVGSFTLNRAYLTNSFRTDKRKFY